MPLLLIHGFPCTSRIWSHNLVPLAEAGFDVVAPDLRGYGDSDSRRMASTTSTRSTPT